MSTKLCIKSSILLFSLLSIATQCKDPVIQFQHHFLEKVNVYPRKNSYSINDTIWLEYINKDRAFFDQTTSQKVFLDTVQLSMSVEFVADYQTNNSSVVKKTYCDFVTLPNTKSSFYNAEDFTRVTVIFGCDRYVTTKLGIIPKVKGNHRIRFFDQNYVVTCPNRVTTILTSVINYQLTDIGKEFVVKVE